MKGAVMERVERVEGEFANRGVVPGRKVVAAGDAGTVLIGHPKATACKPRIELVREGDVIQAIDVTCACGQKVRLHCQYETA